MHLQSYLKGFQEEFHDLQFRFRLLSLRRNTKLMKDLAYHRLKMLDSVQNLLNWRNPFIIFQYKSCNNNDYEKSKGRPTSYFHNWTLLAVAKDLTNPTNATNHNKHCNAIREICFPPVSYVTSKRPDSLEKYPVPQPKAILGWMDFPFSFAFQWSENGNARYTSEFRLTMPW